MTTRKGRGPTILLKNQTIAKAYSQSNAKLGETAALLGVSRKWLFSRIKRDEDLQAMMEDAIELILDRAENALERLVEQGDVRAIKFTLETKGRKRGYGSALELLGNISKPITLVTSAMTPEEASRAYRDTFKPDLDCL